MHESRRWLASRDRHLISLNVPGPRRDWGVFFVTVTLSSRCGFGDHLRLFGVAWRTEIGH